MSTPDVRTASPSPLTLTGVLRDEGALKEALTIKELDCVVHLAAKSIVADSVANPGA